MLPVFIVAFREFLEAFLSVGVLLSISSKFNLQRTKGILGGAIVGFIVVFILATVVFGADSQVLRHLPKDSLDLIEGWLFTLSSLFVAYAVFSLHKILSHYQQEDIKKVEADVTKYKLSYWLLPFSAFLFVFKEGCEGIFFNVTNGLFYTFSQDLTGFGLAFIAAMTCGLIIRNFLTLVSLKRIFRITEVFIIFVGVDAITEGLETLATYYFNIDISDYDMLIALLYVIFVYEVFIRDDKKPAINSKNVAMQSGSRKTNFTWERSGFVGKFLLPIIITVAVIAFVWFYNASTSNATSTQFRMKEVNLVSSVKNYASITDDKLTDAWGLEFGDPGRIWINANSGYSVVYNGKGQYIKVKTENGNTSDLAVQIPVVQGATDFAPGTTDLGAPLTGMVFSKERAFSGDAFTFVTEEGTISGWHPNADGTSPLQAQIRVNNYANGAVYKGVTDAKTSKGWLLYVANFGQNRIDVFNAHYKPVKIDGFVDPNMPKGYAPFNVKDINNQIYVTYAKQAIDDANDIHGLGNGYIDIYTTGGSFVKRLISSGKLDSPWGIVLTPNNFGDLSNYLLVGNFGDGYINVYDPSTGQYKGTVEDPQGNPLQIDGLWSLTFGTNNGAGKINELFFSAGPSAEGQGIFGKLEPIQ